MNIVDLFSGVGGLTFGFFYNIKDSVFVHRNNNFIFANEIDENAAAAFLLNFPNINMVCRDIKLLDEEKIKALVGDQEVDVIIGGPPCQSYSFVGKRRYDDKAQMYKEYLRMLSIIQPKMFVFENVKGILSMKNDNEVLIMDEIKQKFHNIEKKRGYNIQYQVMNASDFGVPQNRERVVVIGIREDLNINFKFPKSNILRKTTLKEAISDLPPITYNSLVNTYRRARPTKYQSLMKQNNRHLTFHKTSKHSEKLEVVMQNVKCGEGKDEFNKMIDDGIIEERYRLTSGYHNTYGRLEPNKPCTTITNNFTSPSCLRCIHYDQNRPLSIREGARIQSFPDTFLFSGKESDIKKQIGNAVPPLLAIAIADAIEKALGGASDANKQ